jgi:hypothetical protein
MRNEKRVTDMLLFFERQIGFVCSRNNRDKAPRADGVNCSIRNEPVRAFQCVCDGAGQFLYFFWQIRYARRSRVNFMGDGEAQPRDVIGRGPVRSSTTRPSMRSSIRRKCPFQTAEALQVTTNCDPRQPALRKT